MTTAAITHTSDARRRRALRADLIFWTIAGAVGAALSRPLSHEWDAPRALLLDVGLAFAVFGPAMLLGLNRMRITRGLIAGFAVTNLVLAPVTLAAAGFGWLGLSPAGDWALADAGAVTLALGAWQFTALRR